MNAMNDSAQDIYTLQIRRQVNPHAGSPYCDACKNGFVHVNSLQVRQFTQTGKLPGVCKSCNDAFLKICRMQIRHLTQLEPNPHVCMHCGKSFSHAGNYRKHVLLHEQKLLSDDTVVESSAPKPPYNCEKCGRSFLKYGSFIKHCNNHDVIKTFTCHICEKIYKSKAILKAHLRIHTVETSFYSCKLCKAKFQAPEDLEEHLLRHVEDQNKCINEGSDSLMNVVDNTVTVGTNEGGKHNHHCTICNKGFVHLGALKNHSLRHTGNLAYECKLCNQKFIHAFHLKKHTQMHQRQKGIKSEESAEVASETQIKDSDKPPTDEQEEVPKIEEGDTTESPVVKKEGRLKTKHFCSICKKGFINLGALKNHFTLHSGNLAFKCRKCNKKFLHAGHLKKHSRKHVQVTYNCKKCQKVYKSRKVFKKHLATHKK